jgi:Protein of unknown function (DUF3040)
VPGRYGSGVVDASENQMSLPARQQLILDQIEKALQAADPGLKSMFAAFARLAPREAMPATEGISGRRRTAMISIVVIGALGMVMVMLGFFATSKACPGLSSDQVVASAAVRYAACSKSTDAWSKGGR